MMHSNDEDSRPMRLRDYLITLLSFIAIFVGALSLFRFLLL